MKQRIGRHIDAIFGHTLYPVLKHVKYGRFRKKPDYVKIETTNLCNSSCVYCPQKTMKRARGVMDETLFRKIIDDCVDWGIKDIHLFNFGEPLVDGGIFERIRYVKDRDPGIKTTIFTNGGLLNEANSRKILESGLDELWISFDGYSKKYFEENRPPFKYERIRGNIISLLGLKKETGSKTKIIINAVYDRSIVSESSVREFCEFWRKQNLDDVVLQRIHNWHGGVSLEKHKMPGNIVCKDIFWYMVVNWDGSVSPCCLDYDGDLIVGDARVSRLKDIWFGRGMTSLRKKMLSDVESIRLCSKCVRTARYPYLSSLV